MSTSLICSVYLTAVPCWERCQILLDKCTQMVTGDADSSLSLNITLFNFYELNCEVVTGVTVSRQRIKFSWVIPSITTESCSFQNRDCSWNIPAISSATFMDLSKAIDCVDPKKLLTKINRYAVHTTPLRWIRSYLSNREHFVSWNQIPSTSLNLNIGVP